MKVVRIHRTGGPDVLSIDSLLLPEPGPNELGVKIEAAGINFLDIYQRSGLFKLSIPLPNPMGREGAGTIEAIGSGVAGLKIGDKIAWADVPGSYATHAIVPAARAVPLPPSISCQPAAAAMLQGMTAHYLVHSTYRLNKGEVCLVHAAAGGVGLLLCQMAKMVGARVLGTVSTEEKAALAREYGADDVVIYTKKDFEAEVKAHTRGAGVDVVYDAVGKDTFFKSLNCLKPRGYMVLYGQASGPVPEIDTRILNLKGALYLTRPSLAYYTANREELLWRANELFEWMRTGALRIKIDGTYPLEAVSKAHERLEARSSSGKLLLVP